MTKSSVSQWDTTAANNTDIADIPLGENQMYPRDVNNAIRTVMGQIATALGAWFATTIELGHATDTTLSRGAAGFMAVEGKRVPSPASQAAGDILYRGTTEWERLPKGTALQVVRQNSALTAPEWATAREVLTANRTYYVRTDGSNSNDGLANTSGGAFLTIQKAINIVYGLDLGGFTVTIQIADGTYPTTTANNLTFDKPFVAGAVIIQGNTTTPTNVIMSTTTVAVVSVTSPGVNVTITGVQFDSTSGALVSVGVAGSNINLALVDFASTTGNHMNVVAQSSLAFTGNYSVSGGANVHWGINNGGAIIAGGRTCTISAAVAITYWAYMYNGGLANVDAMTFTGKANVTGTRYNVTTNACLQTNGGGATYLPGTIAGTTGTGGQYA